MDTPLMEGGPTTLLVVALALLDGSGRVLVQRRPDHRAHGGLWEFPGGKVEAGEGPGGALVREIAEELGISIREADLLPLTFAASPAAGAARPLVLLLFTCHHWQGEPIPEPGAAIAWTDIDALGTLAMPPLDIPLAAALQVHVKNLR